MKSSFDKKMQLKQQKQNCKELASQIISERSEKAEVSYSCIADPRYVHFPPTQSGSREPENKFISECIAKKEFRLVI